MYSRIAGTGASIASAGSQRRAASRRPSRSGIQQCSISRTARGKAVTTLTAGLPAAEGPPSCALGTPGLEPAGERRGRSEQHSEPFADEQTRGEIPAVDDREPEPARRHGVGLERPVLVEGDLDARHAGTPPELVHPVGVDPVPHPVPSEEDDAVGGAPRLVAKAPTPPDIQRDETLEPSVPVEVDPLVCEAKMALDDRPADRLEIHEPGVAWQVAREPGAAVRLDGRPRLREQGPVVEHPVVERHPRGMSPPEGRTVHDRDVAAQVLAAEQRHPEMPGGLHPLVLVGGRDDPPARPHAAEVVDGLAEDRKAPRHDPVRAVHQSLGLADEQLVVDPAMGRKEAIGLLVVGRDDDVLGAGHANEVLRPPWVLLDDRHRGLALLLPSISAWERTNVSRPARSRRPTGPSKREKHFGRCRSLAFAWRWGIIGRRRARSALAMQVFMHACVGLAIFGAGVVAQIGAPRDGGRFMNAVRRPWPGPQVTLPFFLRKAWTSMVGRAGGAPRVPFDPEALLHNPSITWIGHSTMLVRMDGVTFLTDPIFSQRASPVPFAGPKRLVQPGVPLDALPRTDFATLSHDHYDHTDLPSIEALARRGVRFVADLGMGELVRGGGGGGGGVG